MTHSPSSYCLVHRMYAVPCEHFAKLSEPSLARKLRQLHLPDMCSPAYVCKCRSYRTPMLLASVAVGPHLSPKSRDTCLLRQLQVYASMAIHAVAFLARAVNRKVIPMAVQRATAMPSVTQKGNGLSACVYSISHACDGSDMKFFRGGKLQLYVPIAAIALQTMLLKLQCRD